MNRRFGLPGMSGQALGSRGAHAPENASAI